jgi:hypothetical protein
MSMPNGRYDNKELVEFCLKLIPSDVFLLDRATEKYAGLFGPLLHVMILDVPDLVTTFHMQSTWRDVRTTLSNKKNSTRKQVQDLRSTYESALVDFSIARMVRDEFTNFGYARSLEEIFRDVKGSPQVKTLSLPYDDESPILDDRFHGNAKWPRFGRFIINEEARLRSEGVCGTQELTRKISQALDEKFSDILENLGFDPADFNQQALRRVRAKHRDEKLSPQRILQIRTDKNRF